MQFDLSISLNLETGAVSIDTETNIKEESKLEKEKLYFYTTRHSMIDVSLGRFYSIYDPMNFRTVMNKGTIIKVLYPGETSPLLRGVLDKNIVMPLIYADQDCNKSITDLMTRVNYPRVVFKCTHPYEKGKYLVIPFISGARSQENHWYTPFDFIEKKIYNNKEENKVNEELKFYYGSKEFELKEGMHFTVHDPLMREDIVTHGYVDKILLPGEISTMFEGVFLEDIILPKRFKDNERFKDCTDLCIKVDYIRVVFEVPGEKSITNYVVVPLIDSAGENRVWYTDLLFIDELKQSMLIKTPYYDFPIKVTEGETYRIMNGTLSAICGVGLFPKAKLIKVILKESPLPQKYKYSHMVILSDLITEDSLKSKSIATVKRSGIEVSNGQGYPRLLFEVDKPGNHEKTLVLVILSYSYASNSTSIARSSEPEELPKVYDIPVPAAKSETSIWKDSQRVLLKGETKRYKLVKVVYPITRKEYTFRCPFDISLVPGDKVLVESAWRIDVVEVTKCAPEDFDKNDYNTATAWVVQKVDLESLNRNKNAEKDLQKLKNDIDKLQKKIIKKAVDSISIEELRSSGLFPNTSEMNEMLDEYKELNKKLQSINL